MNAFVKKTRLIKDVAPVHRLYLIFAIFSLGFQPFLYMLFGAEDAAEFNYWPEGLTPLFINKLTTHGSGCQDVTIMNLILLPPLPFTNTVSYLICPPVVSNVLFRKTAGGAAGHC